MKVCTKCGVTKFLDDYSASSKDRLKSSAAAEDWVGMKRATHPHCRECRVRYQSKYRSRNHSKVLERDRKYYKKNRDQLLEKKRIDYRTNTEKYRDRNRRYIDENKDKILRSQRKYREANRSVISKKKLREYHKNKHKTQFKVKRAIRDVLWGMVRRSGVSKTDRTHKLLGYSVDQLRQRMECQFKPGMSWENHGEWHIDHKIPVSHFTKKGETRPHIVNALSNLQPLWAGDNMSKSDKYPLGESA